MTTMTLMPMVMPTPVAASRRRAVAAAYAPFGTDARCAWSHSAIAIANGNLATSLKDHGARRPGEPST